MVGGVADLHLSPAYPARVRQRRSPWGRGGCSLCWGVDFAHLVLIWHSLCRFDAGVRMSDLGTNIGLGGVSAVR